MKTVLVTGARGQLGSELQLLAPDYPSLRCSFSDLPELDISSPDSFSGFLQGSTFDFVINCAAYTAVDKAEEEPDAAYLVNGEAPGRLAEWCHHNGSRLLHISTDYVFDGKGNYPLHEQDKTNPFSVYGKSKLMGEKNVMLACPDAYVIRTSWLYSSFGKNFVKTIRRFATEKPFVRVVNDQVGSPTYARDLAAALLDIITAIHTGKADQPGVYHYANEGITSWYDVACGVARFFQLPAEVRAIPTSEYPTPAARPVYTVLDKTKIKAVFGITIPNWYDSLVSCLNTLQENE